MGNPPDDDKYTVLPDGRVVREADDPHAQPKAEPLVVPIDQSTMIYIGDIQRTGLFGQTFGEVVETLLLRGIREAIEMKLIPLRTFPSD